MPGHLRRFCPYISFNLSVQFRGLTIKAYTAFIIVTCSKTQSVCDVCKLAFTDLRMDMGAGPKKQIAIFEPQPSEPKTFVCSIKGCGRKFAWQAHFKYHQLTHTCVVFLSHVTLYVQLCVLSVCV